MEAPKGNHNSGYDTIGKLIPRPLFNNFEKNLENYYE